METEKLRAKLRTSHNRMELLSNTTTAEKNVCKMLDAIGIYYIKQYPIATGRKIFYADIYIPSYRVIIEVDGGYHYGKKQQRMDANRSACIRRLDYHVYRIKNKDTYQQDKIINLVGKIKKNLHKKK